MIELISKIVNSVTRKVAEVAFGSASARINVLPATNMRPAKLIALGVLSRQTAHAHSRHQGRSHTRITSGWPQMTLFQCQRLRVVSRSFINVRSVRRTTNEFGRSCAELLVR